MDDRTDSEGARARQDGTSVSRSEKRPGRGRSRIALPIDDMVQMRRDGSTLKQIATAIGCSVPTVRSRLREVGEIERADGRQTREPVTFIEHASDVAAEQHASEGRNVLDRAEAILAWFRQNRDAFPDEAMPQLVDELTDRLCDLVDGVDVRSARSGRARAKCPGSIRDYKWVPIAGIPILDSVGQIVDELTCFGWVPRASYRRQTTMRRRKKTGVRGTIYVVEAGPWVKIGFTKDADPTKRLTSIQTGCPLRASVAFTIRGDRSLEKTAHDHFDDCRAAGEWFTVGVDEVVDFLRRAKR